MNSYFVALYGTAIEVFLRKENFIKKCIVVDSEIRLSNKMHF